jgi:hypothetical protein
MCHKSTKKGAQWSKWQSGPHSKAYATLATDEAKAVANKAGVEGDPQKAESCLKCHVTGHGVAAERLGSKYDKTEGVSCESCHGAGGGYYKKSTMVAITTGEIDGASVGLKVPDEKTCVECHNEKSPTYKKFVFEERVKEIAHPIPEAKKAEYEKG